MDQKSNRSVFAGHNFWTGKIISFIGDSITYGAYMPSGGHEYIRAEKRYCEIACEILGAQCRNNGISGACISATSYQLPSIAFTKRYRELETDADIVVVAGGSNDFGTSVSLGKKTDKTDISFCGAMNVLCSGLSEMFPKKAIIFLTPFHRHDEMANASGHSLAEYRQIIYDIAGNKYGMFVLDGWSMGLQSSDSSIGSQYMPDGIHPTPQAHIVIGQCFAQMLDEAFPCG